MKKIDKLVLGSFWGPFLVSFGIALFVLVMQFLWLYIDEIAGKGVSIFILIELISYLSIATFPMALPIAVLIASVMVMGNLAERYELSSMKSAGIPLIRVLRMLILACSAIAVFSYVCNDFIIPIANLKFKSRLYDIRKQKPTLTIEEGVFNEDFRNFIIRVGEKEEKSDAIRQVMIEDQTRSGDLRFNQILADSGQMFTTSDKRYFVMKLYDGVQYQEPASRNRQGKEQYPFVRIGFREWQKVWDLKEFEMNRTDEDMFKTQRSMLSMNQLRGIMDSLKTTVDNTRLQIAGDLMINVDRQLQKAEPVQTPPSSAPVRPSQEQQDAVKIIQEAAARERARQAMLKVQQAQPIASQQMDKPLSEYSEFLFTFKPEDRAKLKREAAGRSRAGVSAVETRIAQTMSRKKDYIKTGYELYIKYSFALVCVVFLFIGAPMGAIIRKGGFGYPILVSIVFFVAFVMLTIVCKRLAELEIQTPFWAAMTPCISLAPIGLFLTIKAMNDSRIIETDRVYNFLQWMAGLFRGNKNILRNPFSRLLSIPWFTGLVLLYFVVTGLLMLVLDYGQEHLLLSPYRREPLNTAFRLWTHLGETIAFVGAFLLCLFVRFRASLLIVIAGLLTLPVSYFSKAYFKTDRPIAYFEKNGMKDQVVLVPEIHTNRGKTSFPSGHTMAAFTLYTLLALLFGRLGRLRAAFFAILAIGVGFSRVFLMQHFLADIWAGALVGMVLAAGVWYLDRRWLFRFGGLDKSLSFSKKTTAT